MTSRPVFRDPKLQALFDTQGYVIVPFFDAAEVERLSREVPEFCPADVASNCFDQWSYLSSYDPDRRAAVSEFVRLAMAPHIAELLTGVRIWTGTLLQRQARAGPLVPHQHMSSTADLTEVGMLCWSPLFDCDENSGALQVIPGSHQLLWHVVTATSPPAWQRIADELPDHLVTLNVRAGEAVLFSESLIHGSSPNRRDTTRVAMVSLAIPDDAIPALHVDSQERSDCIDVYRVQDEFAHSDAARCGFSPRGVGERLGTIPANRVALNRRQFDALLANADRIASGADPYLAVADLADPPSSSPQPPVPAPGPLRRFAARSLWAGHRPAVLRRMLKRGLLEPKSRSVALLLWAIWAEINPRGLRFVLGARVKAKNLRARRRLTASTLVEWRPTASAGDRLANTSGKVRRADVGRSISVSRSKVEGAYAGALLPFAGRLYPAELMEQAQAATELSDWGGDRWSEDGFRRRLTTLCAALESEADLSEIGRSRAHSRVHAMLVSRLLTCGFRQERHVPAGIAAPLIGTGLPRSGTSFLQQLLARDPDNFAATTTEALVPVPPAGSSEDGEWRSTLAGNLLDFQGLRSDEINAIHPQGADIAEEDMLLQEAACGSVYQGLFNIPSFAGSLREEDLEDMYRWQKQLMEVIQSTRPVTRWVLKAPMHMGNLSIVQRTFPDAMLFCNHRDPGRAIPSLASLLTTLHRLNSQGRHVDPKQLGPLLLASQMWAVETMNAWRDAHPDIPVVDIQFVELVRDPIQEVERLYNAYGLSLSEKARQAMSAFLVANPHGREHGGHRHRYELAEFGLSPSLIEQSCGAYVQRYRVARETLG